MPILLVTRNASAVVSVAEAAAHARITDPGEYGLLAGLIETATDMVEDYTGLALTVNTYRWVGYSWPDFSAEAFPWHGRRPEQPRRLDLSRTPLVSIESVEYFDTADTEQTVAASNYVADIYGTPGAISFKADYSFPALTTSPRADAVSINFTAGYTPAAIPARAKQAVMILVKHLYDNPDAAGAAVEVMPFSYKALLQSLRV